MEHEKVTPSISCCDYRRTMTTVFHRPLLRLSSGLLILQVGFLGACFGGPRLEACKMIEIEDAEFELDVGDVDIEGGEVEMVCGDDIVDVPWQQFRSKLRINPKDYRTRLAAFEQQVSCFRAEGSRKKEVLCQTANQSDTNKYEKLAFSYDD